MPSVERIAIVAHGKPDTLGDAVKRVEELASAAGSAGRAGERRGWTCIVVLGGDGTMLRALKQSLDTGAPVFGINFGRVGFLTAVGADDFESGLTRALAGDFVVVELPTLEADVGGKTYTAVNDCVATSSTLGRMVDGRLVRRRRGPRHPSCDGVIAARRPARPRTTSRTAGPCSSGGSTRSS
jgi:NAD+ kinase